ncbi:MAG: riboflavin synthase [Moraxellaceae bacterium]|nr:MAG: riboflavin synthase [Moraxellaceae bacterium]
MFTGIVQGLCQVVAIRKSVNLWSLDIEFTLPEVHQLQIGASVAINGCCLTVVNVVEGKVTFDVMMETLKVTGLGKIAQGEWVNFERSARLGDEIGGHLISGHVHTTARLKKVETPENNTQLWFELDQDWMKYIFSKGFIGIDGCSLTIGEVAGCQFNVYLIPETLRVTRFKALKPGDVVNIEIDNQTRVVVDTLESVLERGDFGGLIKR